MAGQDNNNPISDNELTPLFAGLPRFPAVMLAVSGGADSLALLHLYARWRATGAVPSQTALVATVDHGLQPESAGWARFVAAEAHALGLAHETLVWTGPKPATGLQEAAREARYRLMTARLDREVAPAAIVTAHNEDDQAETLLMRLARGSGLDGLAGMPPVRQRPGTTISIARPFLTVPGARLRATLKSIGKTWIEDPANIDPRHERARLRQTVDARGAAGLSNAHLALSARRLLRAREALEATTFALEAAAAQIQPGISTTMSRPTFETAPSELQIRLLERALVRGGGIHPPAQLSEVERLIERLRANGQTTTLGGCVVIPDRQSITILREPGRAGLPVIELEPGQTAPWDGRFQVSLAAKAPAACTVRALTPQEWAHVRLSVPASATLPARAAITVPAFWIGGALVAIPPAGPLSMTHSSERHTPCNAPPNVVSVFAGLCKASPIDLRFEAG